MIASQFVGWSDLMQPQPLTKYRLQVVGFFRSRCSRAFSPTLPVSPAEDRLKMPFISYSYLLLLGSDSKLHSHYVH
jgi:hypothetical protein